MGIFTEKVPAPTIKQNTLPDNGGSVLPQNFLGNTTPYIVEVSLIKDVKDNNCPSSDYSVTVGVLKSCKIQFQAEESSDTKERIDIETILPNALEQIGYEVKRITLNTTFQNWKKLEGGLSVGLDWVTSFREMKEEELVGEKKLIEDGIVSEDNELVRFSKELQGVGWEMVCRREIPGQGLKAVLVKKKKLEVIKQPVAENTQQKLPEVSYQESPNQLSQDNPNVEGLDFLKKLPTSW